MPFIDDVIKTTNRARISYNIMYINTIYIVCRYIYIYHNIANIYVNIVDEIMILPNFVHFTKCVNSF